MENLTLKFIEKMYKLSNKVFNNKEYHIAKNCLIDYIGVTTKGHFELVNEYNISSNVLSENISKNSLNISDGGYLLGLSSHFLDLDDGSRFGGIHIGSPVISTLLSLSIKNDIPADKFLNAIIVGYEAGIRLALSISPEHYKLGYHPTGTCGSLGATVAACVALDFTLEEMYKAFSFSALSTTGRLKILDSGSNAKSVNSANAVSNALRAITLAKTKFTPPIDVLSGKLGFLNIMSNNKYRVEDLLMDNSKYFIETIYFKKVSSCRHTHALMEAMSMLRLNVFHELENIKTIRARIYEGVKANHGHVKIENVLSAKMSIPYNIAISLIYEYPNEDSYNKNIWNSKVIKDLMEKVLIVEDEELTKNLPFIRPAIIEIEMNNGTKLVKRVDFPKGEPENPMTTKEIYDKFYFLMKSAQIDKFRIYFIYKAILNFEKEHDIIYSYIKELIT